MTTTPLFACEIHLLMKGRALFVGRADGWPKWICSRSVTKKAWVGRNASTYPTDCSTAAPAASPRQRQGNAIWCAHATTGFGHLPGTCHHALSGDFNVIG